MRIKDIMTKHVMSAKVDTSINEVLELMRAHDIGFVPVLDGTKLVGVITDKDIILNELKYDEDGQEEYFNKEISTIMSRKVIKINENTQEKDAYQIIQSKKLRRLPVVDDNDNLTGIISINDLDATRMKLL